jgi:hypothetical protein
VRRDISILMGKPLCRRQGAKDVTDVDPAWTDLGGGWFIVALDRMA